MDSPLPLRERIVLDVCATLSRVTTAAAYDGTLIVERPNPASGNRARDRLVVVIPGNPVKVQDEAQSHVGWLMPMHVKATVIESETSCNPVDARLNVIAADIEKALTEDGSHTRGGLAIDTTVDDPDYGEADLTGQKGEVVCNFQIYYRHLVGDPYSQ